MIDFSKQTRSTKFRFPIDGDCLNADDGTQSADNLMCTVIVESRPNCQVIVNDTPARYQEQDHAYYAKISLQKGLNRLIAKNTDNLTEDIVSVFFLPETKGKYRISSDDNILFLHDITQNKDIYTSIFDNPYLSVYKKAHDLFGAKVHLNLFYEFNQDSAQDYEKKRQNFDLSMMTDKFKNEWEKNSDWLKLSFHARSEYPDKPYQFAVPATIISDYQAVRNEIIRFAGEKTFSNEITTIHWGEMPISGVSALRKNGQKALMGYFEISPNGEPVVSYYLPTAIAEHVGERDFWYDKETDMFFGRIDRVLNSRTLEYTLDKVRFAMEHPHRGGFVSIMIHEQYFYSDYKGYLSDFEERVLESAKLLFEHGYTGAFITEVL